MASKNVKNKTIFYNLVEYILPSTDLTYLTVVGAVRSIEPFAAKFGGG